MRKRCNVSCDKVAVPLTSLVILTFLFLQTVASFNLTFGPIERSPWLYPFLDYPMYNQAHYNGETVYEYFVVGILMDSTEVPIHPEDLGLHFWLYRRGLAFALIEDNHEKIKGYAELYQRRHNKQLLGLRLEIHPRVLSAEGVRPASPQVLKTFRLQSFEKEK